MHKNLSVMIGINKDYNYKNRENELIIVALLEIYKCFVLLLFKLFLRLKLNRKKIINNIHIYRNYEYTKHR